MQINRTLLAILVPALGALSLLGRSPAPAAGETFTIFVYETPAEVAARTDVKRAQAYWASYGQYGEAMQAAGVLRGGSVMKWGADVRTIRVRSGRESISIGPATETRDHLGGYFVIEARGMEEALKWAAKCPAASTGKVEVRPAYPAPSMSR